VAAFGAFVDVGVHQDGLVHISAMSNKFVSNPHEVVKSGQVVTVKVLEADPDRKRISLSLRLDDEAPAEGGARQGQRNGARPGADSGRNRRDDAGRNRGGDRDRNRGGETRQGRRGNSGRQQRPQAGGSNSNTADTAMAEALRRAGLGK
jgi:protein Tex